MKVLCSIGGDLKKAKIMLLRHFGGNGACGYPQLEARGVV